MPLLFRFANRVISSFSGSPEAYLNVRSPHISTLTIVGPTKLWSHPLDQARVDLIHPSDEAIDHLMTFIEKDGHVKSLDLEAAILSKQSMHIVAQRIKRCTVLESLRMNVKTLDEDIMVNLLQGLIENQGLKEFTAVGRFMIDGNQLLSNDMVSRIAHLVEANLSLQNIDLRGATVSDTGRDCLQRPYTHSPHSLPNLTIGISVKPWYDRTVHTLSKKLTQPASPTHTSTNKS